MLLPIRSGVRQSSDCLLSIRGNDTLRKAKALRIWTAERVSGPLMAFFSLVQGTEMYNTFLRYPFKNLTFFVFKYSQIMQIHRLLGAKVGEGCVILCSM
jgi:hypothetical protein